MSGITATLRSVGNPPWFWDVVLELDGRRVVVQPFNGGSLGREIAEAACAAIAERDKLREALELLLEALEETRLGSGRGNDAVIFSSDIRDGIRGAREALGEGK